MKTRVYSPGNAFIRTDAVYVYKRIKTMNTKIAQEWPTPVASMNNQ